MYYHQNYTHRSHSIEDRKCLLSRYKFGCATWKAAKKAGSEIPMSDLLVINGSDTDILEGIQVTITENFEASEDLFSYTFANNIRGTFDAANGIYTLSGQSTIANYRLALERLFFTSTTENLDRKTINITLSGVNFLVETGHFYQFFAASGISWADANAAAKTKEVFGLEGYLTTITSSSENQFILDRVSGTAWIGASDVQQEGAWRWVTGSRRIRKRWFRKTLDSRIYQLEYK